VYVVGVDDVLDFILPRSTKAFEVGGYSNDSSRYVCAECLFEFLQPSVWPGGAENDVHVFVSTQRLFQGRVLLRISVGCRAYRGVEVEE